MKVLLVEDDRDLLDVLTAALEDAGHQVTQCRLPGEAIDAQGPFDVQVIDIMLPEVSGFEVLEARRNLGHAEPAIALSGHTELVLHARRTGSPFAMALMKPLEMRELTAAVEEAVRAPAA